MARLGDGYTEAAFKRSFERELLGTLLRKYEQSQAFVTGTPGKQRPQLVLGKSPFVSDYQDEMDFRKRQWMNEVLIGLEGAGMVELAWVKFRIGKEVERIYLQWDGVEAAYERSGCIPLKVKLEQMSRLLEPLEGHPWEWVAAWAQRVRAGLSEGKTAHLDLEDLEGYGDLARALVELASSDGRSVPIRLFSQRLFHDSKHMEKQVLKRLLALVKQASGEERDTDEEWLDLLGLARNPQYLYLSGPLQVKCGERERVSLGELGGSVGLAGSMVEDITELWLSARRIVTIENLTSYHQWLEQRAHLQKEELVIYTGGFPHRSLQRLLAKLSSVLEPQAGGDPVDVLHWGDIDLGGIRIYEYLKERFFPSLAPLWMDADTLIRYEASAAAVTEDYAGRIRQLLADARYPEWTPVLEIMLERRIRLEQETITGGL